MQAALPSSCHQRHWGRIMQAGRPSSTAGSKRTILVTRPHRLPSKFGQALQAHGAAKRNTSVGKAGKASASRSAVTGCGVSKCRKRGASTEPTTTPRATDPGKPGSALGQSKGKSARVDAGFTAGLRVVSLL